MDDQIKTKARLLEELEASRNRVQELEAAEKELRENCDVYRNIFELAPHLVSITRMKDGLYLQVNEAFCRLTGYGLDEIIGYTAIDLNLYVDPVDRQRLLEVLSQENRVEGVEIKFRKKDGPFFYNLVSARPYRFKGEDCILLMATEVTPLKKIEESLRESEEKYRLLVENAGEGILVAQDGKIKFINPRITRIIGYEFEEIRNRSFIDFIHPDDREMVLKRYEQRLAGETVPGVYEFRAVAKDGNVRIIEIRAVGILWQGRPATLNMLADVTERNQAEEKYRNIVENMEEGVFEIDLAGTYTFVNEAVCRYHGRTREELIGLNNRSYMTPETAKRVFTLFNEKYRQAGFAKRFDLDFEIISKNGTLRHLQMSATLTRDTAGRIIGFRGITWDATEQKAAEANLERYRDFVENVEDGCFEVDLSGNMTFFNEAACRIFGYPREEFKGMNNRQYTTPETAKRIYQIFNEIYRTGIPKKIFEYEIIQKEGQIRYLTMSVSLIRDAKGNPIGFRGIDQDVTERNEIEAERERLTEQLNQARNLEAVGTLAGGIAHDFNNILMSIQGYASLMMLDLDAVHPHYERLKVIGDQVKTGAELTRQLLGYARGGRYEVVSTDLNELLRKTSALFGRMKKNIRIHHHYALPLWLANADRGQIEQVLLSLFMNSSDAMPGGGALVLETANVQLDESYVRPYEVPFGPYVKISVTDTGVGMDKKTRNRIFEPFFTTKEMGRGVGLGLAPVYGIIKGHNGLIEVFSEKGEGTTFNIYLPARQEQEQLPVQPVREKPASLGTILLVDDEKVIIDVVGAMLTGLGYQVHIARNGEEAVQLYRDYQEKIDLVIMDMVMPGIGGGEAIDIIKNINPQARIILASGYSLEGEAKEILERGGASLFLQKPFMLQDLSTKIKQVLNSEL